MSTAGRGGGGHQTVSLLCHRRVCVCKRVCACASSGFRCALRSVEVCRLFVFLPLLWVISLLPFFVRPSLHKHPGRGFLSVGGLAVAVTRGNLPYA